MTQEGKMSAQEIIQSLQAKGFSLPQIVKLLENRVTSRTLYRWLKGDAKPQRQSDVDALKNLLEVVSG